MLNYPHVNPIAWQIGPYQFQHPFEWQLGPFAIHWYGVMYLIGFLICWGIVSLRVKNSDRGFDQEQVSDILFYTALGVIIGGRLGYMLFYDWSDFCAHPLLVFQVWRGGMSFHGGLIGVITALWIYARTIKKTLFDITDLIAPIVPIGLGLGRIGNFINGELWGRVTTMPWGMVFPNGGPEPRHPSQLYEFFFEGVVMFTILWLYSMKPRPRGAVSGLFLICYGAFRFAVEFFREPDLQKGYIAFGWMTEGQLFSFPMILIGIAFMMWAYRSAQRCNNI